jgi:AraC-like DNA-binding protein
MTKHSISRASSEAEPFLKSAKGENLGYSQIFEQIRSQIPMTEAMIVTTLPRGTLQIAQPQRLPEQIVRMYAKDAHLQDRLTWGAIEKGRAVRAADCWDSGQWESSRFFTDFLAPNRFRYAAAAPLKAPVFEGYPGAIHLYRTAEQGAFTNDELALLSGVARKLDLAIAHTRSTRRARTPVETESFKRFDDNHTFIFDKQLRPLPVGADPKVLDERLRQQMLQVARNQLDHLNGDASASDRTPLADSHGDLWVFRVITHRDYPALGGGPFVFFCLQPNIHDWSALRSADFQADNELSRLVPAIRFMEQEFHRGPTLGEIAKQVHLSPFHFHRRFTELLGITPKHFLLDCQIDQAKKQLLSREMELADIAKACGFAHQSHFTSRFKQATGLTPTRWRRFATEKIKSAANN